MPGYFCPYCVDHKYNKINNIKLHFRSMHPKKTFHYISDAIQSNNQRCLHCKMIYPAMNIKRFLNHCRGCVSNPCRNNNRGALFECQNCSTTFSRMNNLVAHVRKFHKETPPKHETISKTVVEADPEFADAIQSFVMGEIEPSLLVDLSDIEKKKSLKLGVNATKLNFKLSDLALRLSISGLFPDVIETAFNYLTELHNMGDNDLMNISLNSESYLTHGITTGLATNRAFQIENLLRRLEVVVQSFGDLPAQSDLTLELTSFGHHKVGRPINAKKYSNLDEYLANKRGYLNISKFQTKNNQHNKACLPLSIALALHYGKPYSEIKRNFWYKNDETPPLYILHLSEQIYTIIGQEYNTTIELTNENFQRLQIFLNEKYETNLEIFEMRSANQNSTILLFPQKELNIDTDCISLLAANGHVGLITCKETFFGKLRYKKRTMVNTLQYMKCHLCKSSECIQRTRGDDEGKRKILCKKCNRHFKNEFCYKTHKEPLASEQYNCSTCEITYRCKKCSRTLSLDKEHYCCYTYCNTCKKHVLSPPPPLRHQCFIPPEEPKEPQDKLIHFIYDIECEPRGNSLIPNLFVLFRSCPQCFDDHDPNHDKPNCCGKRLHVWKGDKCVELAVTHMFFQRKYYRERAIAIAHYASGFDSAFLLQTLLSMNHIPLVISTGLKILVLEYNNVHCIDSYMFFHAKLAKLPELFGFQQRKSFFPLKFNPEDKNYDGEWPDENDFPSAKTEQEKIELREWLVEQKRQYPTFNYWKQLEIYCTQDVLVLHLAVAKFRSMVLQYANCEPFAVAITLASLSGYIFRLNFVNPNEIAVLADYQVLRDKCQSKIGLLFMGWLQNKKYTDLQTALNGPEVRLGNYKVDGYSTSRKLIVEFNGCHFHACLKPIHGDRATIKHPSYPGYTYEDVHQITVDRELKLKNEYGFETETYWECEVERMHDFQVWLKESQALSVIINPINNLREGLYGGRVEVSLPLVEINQDEMDKYCIRYKDANHLYPSVQQSCPFPMGHPTIINGWSLNDCGRNFTAADCDKYFGLIKVQVMYPASDCTYLYHAILPFHNEEQKLIFGLCRTCSEEQRHNSFCDHTSENDRSWIGTYCSTELKLALENGYRVLRVFQILKFDDISDTLFLNFMKCYLRLKYIASGYPSEYKENNETKLQFLKELFEKENISLNLDEICDPPNPSLKLMAKYLINALWGKMAENKVKSSSKTQFVRTERELKKLLFDYQTNVTNFRLINDDTALVERQTNPEFVQPGQLNNPVISSFVTAHARCVLASYLLKLRHRVIYCDTDSIIYYQRKGVDDDPIKTGPFSHQWKDEEPSGLKNFACMSPKSYIYETNDGNRHFKCKGLSMTGLAAGSFEYTDARNLLLSRTPELLEALLERFYDKITNDEMREKLKMEHKAFVAKNPDRARTLIFDDCTQISSEWKKPNPDRKVAFRVDDRRTKRMTTRFDKRSVFHDKKYTLDSIVKIRSFPFGITDYDICDK